MTAGSSSVSVVIAVPAELKWDGRALESVLRNQGPQFEVWIAAASASVAALSHVADAKDPRVRFLQTTSRASAAIHNEAIARATGSIVAVTDLDCEVGEDWVGAMLAAFGCDPRIGMVFGNVYPAAAHGDRRVPSYTRDTEFLAREPREKSRVEGIWACMGIRRDAWIELGGFDERFGLGARFPGCADGDLALRALAAGWYVLETPRVSVTMHRALPRDVHRQTVSAYTYASGALIGKHLRSRTPGILSLVSSLAKRWARGRSHSAVGLAGDSQRFRRLIAFLRGLACGLAQGAVPAASRIARTSAGRQ
jgi:hypothetical protein